MCLVVGFLFPAPSFAVSVKKPLPLTAASPAPSVAFSTASVTELLKRLKKEQRSCKLPSEKRPSICHHEKFLLAMESLMQSYLAQQAKLDRLAGRVVYLDEENSDLKTSIRAERQPAAYVEKKTCYKPDFLRRIMLDNGITENGSSVFSKQPVPGAAGVCWSNSKKKKEASFSLCNYPLAIDIRTKGGSDLAPTILEKEYLFSLNGCDLLSVHLKEESVKGSSETLISYNQCLEQWNKRTADAAMTPLQVKLMEDTIGLCFREHLLPPRETKNGRDVPARPMPVNPNQDSKSASTDPKG